MQFCAFYTEQAKCLHNPSFNRPLSLMEIPFYSLKMQLNKKVPNFIFQLHLMVFISLLGLLYCSIFIA